MASEAAACLLCTGATFARLRKFGHIIRRCERCDFEFVHPTPGADDLAHVYERNYFEGEGAVYGYGDYFERERASNRRKASQRLARLLALGLPPSGRVLDYGCADGAFVSCALESGLDAYGVEPSAAAARAQPTALRSRIAQRLEAVELEPPCDAITLFDVLEHLSDPITTLRMLRSYLRPGGILAVVVPVIDNLNARHFPSTWDQYKPPEHLNYFSRSSLRATLEREVGTVLCEETAWRRYARFFDVRRAALPVPLRPLRLVERAMFATAATLGWIDERRLDDSAAFYARCAA